MTLVRSVFILSVSLFVSFCSSKKNENDTNTTRYTYDENDSEDLILNISVRKPDLAIGFGNVYNCKVNKTEMGFIEDSVLSITILGGEHEKDSLFLTSASIKKNLKIGFKKHRENEPYRMMPISGFVDGDNNSWRITYIEISK